MDREPRPRRPRRDKRRDRNRAALLQAGVELLKEGGSAAISPVRIAKEAGLHKPAFYAHFSSVHECKKALAEQIIGQTHERRIEAMHRMLAPGVPDANKREAIYQNHLETLKSACDGRDHAFHSVQARTRGDSGPLGDGVRTIIERLRRDWTEIFWDMATRMGIDGAYLPQVEAMAAVLVEMGLSSASRAAAGDLPDLEAEARRLERYGYAIVSAEFTRMLASPDSAS